jgi:hypothetical protein
MRRLSSNAASTAKAYIAYGAIVDYLDGNYYLKISCAAGDCLPGPRVEPIQTARPAPIPFRDAGPAGLTRPALARRAARLPATAAARAREADPRRP